MSMSWFKSIAIIRMLLPIVYVICVTYVAVALNNPLLLRWYWMLIVVVADYKFEGRKDKEEENNG